MHFAIGEQLRVWMVIDSNIKLALEFLERMPEGAGLDGVPRSCRAHTRKGTPCQREPLPSRDYCPSHKHLEEVFDGPEIPLEAARGGCARSTQRLPRLHNVGVGRREAAATWGMRPRLWGSRGLSISR